MNDKLCRHTAGLLRRAARLLNRHARGLNEHDTKFLAGLAYLDEQGLRRRPVLSCVLEARRIADRAVHADRLGLTYLLEARVLLDEAKTGIENKIRLLLARLDRAAWKHCPDTIPEITGWTNNIRFHLPEDPEDSLEYLLDGLERTVRSAWDGNPKFRDASLNLLRALRQLVTGWASTAAQRKDDAT